MPTGFKTREEYNEYMKTYLRGYRERERLKRMALEKLKKDLDVMKQAEKDKIFDKEMYRVLSDNLLMVINSMLLPEFRQMSAEEQITVVKDRIKLVATETGNFVKKCCDAIDQVFVELGKGEEKRVDELLDKHFGKLPELPSFVEPLVEPPLRLDSEKLTLEIKKLFEK